MNHLDESGDTPWGRFFAASWDWARAGSTPGGTDIGQSHMGSIKTPNVSLVTPSMHLILEPYNGDV